MIDLAMLSLIESILPNGAYFNKYGVLQFAYLYAFKVGKVSVRYSCFSINGIWGGVVDMMGRSWGYGSPLTRRSLKHTTFEECVDYLWKYSLRSISSSEPNVVNAFIKTYTKWKSLSSEEKFKCFKIRYLYGKEQTFRVHE